MKIVFYYNDKSLLNEIKKELKKSENMKLKKEYNIKMSYINSDKFRLQIYNGDKLIKTYFRYNFNNLKKFIEKNFNNKISNINFSLYSDDNPDTTLQGTGFKNKEKAYQTIKLIKNKDIIYQKQIINTMINRAKYHPYQTKEMKEAINIFNDYYEMLKIK